MFTRKMSFRGTFGFIAILFAGFQMFAGEPVDWTGWHAGVFGSYVSGKLNSDDITHSQSTKDYKDDMPMAGISGGYYHQFENNWVGGAELIVPLYMKKGTATDKEYYPDSVKYEASYRYGLLIAAKGGLALRKALPYAFGALGFINVDGKTLNVRDDENETYSPGFVQSAAATHFVWQFGAGIDYQLGGAVFLGARVAMFRAAPADHTMPWNEPGPNNFGYNSLILQLTGGYRF